MDKKDEGTLDSDTSIRSLKGIGQKTEQLLQSVGVYTLRDILLYFPRDYVEYPKPCDPALCQPGRHAALFLHVTKAPSINANSRSKTAILDISGGLRAIWFHAPYIRSVLKRGKDVILYGRISEKKGVRYLEQPAIFSPDQYEQLLCTVQPVYPLTGGLKNQVVRKAVSQALACLEIDQDPLPQALLEKYDLCSYAEALAGIHFPPDRETCIRARKRLVFEEFFAFLLRMHFYKDQEGQTPNPFLLDREPDYIKDLTGRLPYALTGAQTRALEDVCRDLTGDHIMQRLIQGDVGSGKTVIAFLAMLQVSKHGYQAALMAPTDVLARQHAGKLDKFCREMGHDADLILLTGSLKAGERREALKKIKSSPNALIVGTHALIQDFVDYAGLALVITDEQHRFGVHQRELFAAKGVTPHYLVMSATPIPRTLALILYGDLDISVIDELPAMRLPVKNCLVPPSYRETAYRFMEKEIRAGHQVYVVCPFVEEPEEIDGENVLDYARRLSGRFQGIARVGILHGRMKPEEKNAVMEAFLKKEIQILTATTVIEVGVDVPNATVMMIENAERFGLAQLHQLRGRVGRGHAQSYCIFIQGDGKQETNPRLDILNKSNDGFYVANEDLKLRGPGDFFGIRQSGDLEFRLADVFGDQAMLKAASAEVAGILTEDPKLKAPHHAALRDAVLEKGRTGLFL